MSLDELQQSSVLTHTFTTRIKIQEPNTEYVLVHYILKGPL